MNDFNLDIKQGKIRQNIIQQPQQILKELIFKSEAEHLEIGGNISRYKYKNRQYSRYDR